MPNCNDFIDYFIHGDTLCEVFKYNYYVFNLVNNKYTHRYNTTCSISKFLIDKRGKNLIDEDYSCDDITFIRAYIIKTLLLEL